MMTVSYVAQILEWNEKAKRNRMMVFRIAGQDLFASAQRTVSMGGNMPVDTGFLRNSVIAQLNGSTTMTGADAFVAGIAGMSEGDEVVVGWTADYARHVHDGTKHMKGTLFLALEVQNWQRYIDSAAKYVGSLP